MYEPLEGWIHLHGHCFPRVEFLEGENVRLDKNADGGRDYLVVGIRNLSNSLDLLTLLDSVEEHLGRAARGHHAPEQCVIVKQGHHVGLAIQILGLVQDFDDSHR